MRDDQVKNNLHYNTIVTAIRYLVDKRHLQPTLAEVSAHVGLSEFHLQRIFSEWAGVSPKQFLQYLTKEHAKSQLRKLTVMEAAFTCGLSGPSRLYDLMVNCEGITPGEYKSLGEGIVIYYGTCLSPFGQCFIAMTTRGICKLAFFDNELEQNNLEIELRQEWQRATLIRDNEKIDTIAQTIFTTKIQTKVPLKLLMKGSPFQLKVWEALLSIPQGQLATYQDIATAIEKPTAVRAVASAIAKNTIAYLIPCHRIIRQTGEFGQYRWDKYRKQALIAWEVSTQKTH